MKKITALLLALRLLVSFTACSKPEVPAEVHGEPGPKDIVILFTSDVHGSVDSGWTYSGIDVIQ